MFIRYYMELAHPSWALELVLLKAPSSWLPSLAERADEHGQRLLIEVGFPADGHRIVKRVTIAVGEPCRAYPTCLQRAVPSPAGAHRANRRSSAPVARC
jgi:hypothetical protein